MPCAARSPGGTRLLSAQSRGALRIHPGDEGAQENTKKSSSCQRRSLLALFCPGFSRDGCRGRVPVSLHCAQDTRRVACHQQQGVSDRQLTTDSAATSYSL